VLKHGHSSRNAMRDLAQDSNAPVLIRNGVIDLDSPVDRPRVKHDCVGLQTSGTLRGQSK
jgi:hypothetical protein